MAGRAEGADAEPGAVGRDRVPGHVRLGVPSNLPAELSTFVGRVGDFNGARGCSANRGW